MSENNKLCKLEKRLGYCFSNPQLLITALTHRSKSKNNNERLEFLGDALLETILSDALFKMRPQANEGDLTRLRATMVRGSTLAILGDELGLKDFMLVGSGELRTGGYQRASTIADAFEAIIAAIYLDSDSFVTTQKVVIALYQQQLAELPDADDLKDSKTKLQEKLQALGQEKPIYELLQITGPDHAKQFEVTTQVGGISAVATGASKKKAEQEVANKILEKLNEKL